MKKWMVYDIGGTLIKFALMTADGTALQEGSVPSPSESVEALVQALVDIQKPYAGQYAGVAVSMPGCIDTSKGIAHTGGYFVCIQHTPLAAMLEEQLHCPVTLGNDGKCAATAEAVDGALADVENGAAILLGTGIGGGIVLNHQVLMGSTFAAGEFSLLPTDMKSIQQGVGGMGDANMQSLWANRASAASLMSSYAVRKGLPPMGHGIDGFAFFAALEAGDVDARECLKELCGYAAAGILALQSVLDLQRYAIGGGISKRPEVTQGIREAVDELYAKIPFIPFGKPEIVRCKYGNEANLRGVLRLHLQRVGEDA